MNNKLGLKKGHVCYAVSALIILILMFVFKGLAAYCAQRPIEQGFATRWSKDKDYAQSTVFLSVEAELKEDDIETLRHKMDTLLANAGVVKEDDFKGRLWVDAYSGNGTVDVSFNKNSGNFAAVGVSGDFFLFHPLKLLSGTFFSDDDIMDDYIIVDQDVAWQLFGSADIAGQYVTINSKPYIIKGVIERDTSLMYKMAGLDKPVVYMSLNALRDNGTFYYINCYELLAPEPVDGFGIGLLKEELNISENNAECVDNTKRFDYFSVMKLIPGMLKRVMNSKSIIFPYWENVARGYEDILIRLYSLYTFCLAYVIIFGIGAVVFYYRRKNWTIISLCRSLYEKLVVFVYKIKNYRRFKDEEE
ncbi:MAG: ABC transporter permease [Lachnospiraceae bacterium]|nr:ABC transporter permease [Lachnospiraceae bacterium]